MIQKFNTEADWAVAEKSTTESTIAYIEESKLNKVNGVNVLTTSPRIGDILCVNGEGKKLWVTLDTYVAAGLPDGYAAQGVVAQRHGNKLLIASRGNPKRMWMAVYPYVVTGYTLDGVEHTARIRLTGLPSTTTWYEFKYTATTDDEFVTALAAFLAENANDWSAYKDDAGRIILQRNKYDSWEYYTASRTYCDGGLTLTEKIKLDVQDILGRFPSGYYASVGRMINGLWNYRRGSDYLSDDISLSAVFNPTSTVTTDYTQYPICYPAYSGKSEHRKDSDGNYVDYCAYLRKVYGEGKEGWLKYLKAETLIPRSPMVGGGQLRNEREITNAFAEVTYKDTEGNSQYLYPAFRCCHDIDLGTDGLTSGNFFLPNIMTIIDCMGEATLGIRGVSEAEFDPLNRSLITIGADRRPVNWAYWQCSPHSVGSARSADGSGYYDSGYYCGALYVGAFALYDLAAEQQ